MFDWVALVFIAAISTLAVLVGDVDPIKEPYRVDVCLVHSGPKGEDVTTNLWSDQIEVYFEKWPGSYCGACGKEKACPK